MFEEVDYLQEGQNAERFGRLYGLHTPNSKWLMFASINHHTHSKEKGYSYVSSFTIHKKPGPCNDANFKMSTLF